MKKTVSSLLICAAALALVCAVPATGAAEGVEGAVEAALNNHPAVAAAQAGRAAAQADHGEQRSAFFPELNVNAAAGRVYGDTSTTRGLTVDRGAGYSWSAEGGITARQTIYDGMQTPNRVRAAASRMDVADMNLADTRENLALSAVLAYLEVLRGRESIAMVRAHEQKIVDYRTRIKAMVDQGGADEAMDIQARDILTQLDGTLADIEGELRKAMADYAELVGRTPSESMTRPRNVMDRIPADIDSAVATTHQAHPALIAARMQGEAARYDARAAQGALYPGIVGEVSAYKKDVDDVLGGEVEDHRALVRMNWNFSTGGAQSARIRAARHRQAETEARAQDLAGRIDREIRKSYAELDAARERLAIAQDRVRINADLISAYEKQFEVSRVSLLNLLQVENAHFNARLGALNSEFRHLSAQYAALAALGRLQSTLNVQPVMAAHEQ